MDFRPLSSVVIQPGVWCVLISFCSCSLSPFYIGTDRVQSNLNNNPTLSCDISSNLVDLSLVQLLCPSVYMHHCLCICLTVCLSASLSVHLFYCCLPGLSACLLVYICLFTHTSLYLPLTHTHTHTHVSICLLINIFIYPPSAHLFICLVSKLNNSIFPQPPENLSK